MKIPKYKKKCKEISLLVDIEEEIDNSLIESAISFVNNQFDLDKSLPNFIAPTVNSGVLISYMRDDKRIDIRFEKEKSYMVIIENGSVLYNGDINNKLWK